MQAAIHSQPITGTARLVLSALIVIATVLFVVGVAVERSGYTDHHEVIPSANSVPTPTVATVATPQQSEATGVSGESGEGESAETHAAEQGQGQATPAAHQEAGESGASETVASESGSETVLGIDIENPWIITAFVLAWLALLVALFLLGRPGLILILLAALASAVFDIAEIRHQIERSTASVAIIAALVAAAHIGIVGLAIVALMRRVPPKVTTASAL